MENSTRPNQNQMLKLEYTDSLLIHYKTENSCESSGCYDEGICRCGRIEDAYVHSVNLSQVTESIYSQFLSSDRKAREREIRIAEILYGGEIVDKYCIYRILVINKVFDTNYWKVNICGGYYGQEVEDGTISGALLFKINDQCQTMFRLETLSQKLRYVLELEYGFLLDDVKDCQFELISIYKSHIDFKKLNQNHIKNVKMEDLSYYDPSQYLLPRGIVRGEIDNYKIVDGFHRIISSIEKKPFGVFRVIKNTI